MILFQTLGDESRRMEYDAFDRKTSFHDTTSTDAGMHCIT